MSIAFPSANIQALRTPLRNAPIGLLNPQNVQPRSLLAQIKWSDYGVTTAKPTANILVGMQAGGAQSPIDQIRSVKIDNLSNPFPVYVYFLDTTDTIVAAPNTIVWEPVVTNSKVANVIIEGATELATMTNVYFCNVAVPPYVNAEISNTITLWKVSASNSQGGNITNTNYGAPAVCDQTIPMKLPLSPSGNSVDLILGSSDSFVYINFLQMCVTVTNAAGGSHSVCDVLLFVPGFQSLWQWNWYDGGPTGVDTMYDRLFPSASGLNLKYRGGLNLRLSYDVGPDMVFGNARLLIGYTTNPY